MFALTASLPTVAQAQKIPPDQLEFFEKKIRPILVQKCYECHSSESKEVKGGLLLDTRDGIRMGGETGHAIVPGEVESRSTLTIFPMMYWGSWAIGCSTPCAHLPRATRRP